ncbi:hypothetical protein L873DRAFT_1841059 [Choiromyces venosus 120613-1]|uniref:Uncharacterized protein n=1 Tax=Choiromyces venosus 120613-1 TaxID=1336337 RepID=A0A3N4K3H2_9PEZI|nr:hypothetical protein L873DRAFT_1841059 [Choiromyces venosus 120613-1]
MNPSAHPPTHPSMYPSRSHLQPPILTPKPKPKPKPTMPPCMRRLSIITNATANAKKLDKLCREESTLSQTLNKSLDAHTQEILSMQKNLKICDHHILIAEDRLEDLEEAGLAPVAREYSFLQGEVAKLESYKAENSQRLIEAEKEFEIQMRDLSENLVEYRRLIRELEVRG